MADTSKIREQIDACRADRDELRLPEFQELAAALGVDSPTHNPEIARQFKVAKQFDRAVYDGLQDIRVPENLLAKLLANANASAAGSAGVRECESDVLTSVQNIDSMVAIGLPSPIDHAKTSRRSLLGRRAIAVLITIAAVALLTIGIRLSLPPKSSVVSQDELLARAEQWSAEVFSSTNWQPTIKQAPLATHPVDATIRVQPRAWRQAKVADDLQAVAFDLTRPGRQRAVLLVIRSADKYPVAAPPAYTRLSASRGMRLFAWQRANLLYVLALDQDERIDDYLRPAQLTFAPSRR